MGPTSRMRGEGHSISEEEANSDSPVTAHVAAKHDALLEPISSIQGWQIGDRRENSENVAVICQFIGPIFTASDCWTIGWWIAVYHLEISSKLEF